MSALGVKKTSAVVPAFNEEKSVGSVLRVLLSSKFINETILVDDGSADKTAEIGRSLGAKVISLGKNSGKGNAMEQGVKASDAEIIAFFDADLLGLTESHIEKLMRPILEENVDMCVGVRGRWFGLPMIIAKIDPLLAIGGERAIRKNLFEQAPEKMMQGFKAETALNFYCLENNKKVKYVLLENLDIVTKERKWGIIKGFINRIKMFWDMFKIRFEIKKLRD